MTGVREVWLNAANRLAEAQIDSARLDARVLLASAMDVMPDELLSCRPPTSVQLDKFESYLSRRIAREPLAYIAGRKEFMSLSFVVGPGALVPRPETETLLDEAFKVFPRQEQELKVLDLGTGSGCLLISFLRYYPNARGIGVDRSADAMAWARANAENLGVAARCEWRHGDWASALPGSYDVVFSNPPYLALPEQAALSPEIVHYEPHEALFGGVDGLDAYRALAPVITAGLAPEGGFAFIEIGRGQQLQVSRILTAQGLEIAFAKPDLAGIARCVVARRAIGFRGTVAEKTVGNLRSSR